MKNLCLQSILNGQKLLLFSVFLFCAVLFLGVDTAKAFTESNIIAYYPMLTNCNDAVSGSYAFSGKDLTPLGTYAFNTDIFGGGLTVSGSGYYSGDLSGCAISSDGSATDPFYLPNTNNGLASSTFTFAFRWIGGSQPNTYWGTFFARGPNSDYPQYAFRILTNGKLSFYFQGNDGGGYAREDIWTSDNAIIGSWPDSGTHDLAVEGTIEHFDTTFKVFVDGTEIGGSWSGYLNDTFYNFTSQSFAIGSQSISYRTFGLNGKIGNFALFNKLLDSTEIGLLHTMSVSAAIGYSTPKDYLYYPGIGTTINNVDPYKGFQIPYLFNVCGDPDVYAAYIDFFPDGWTDTPNVVVIQPIDQFIGPQQCSGSGVINVPYGPPGISISASSTAILRLTVDHATATPTIVDINLNYNTKNTSDYLQSGVVSPLNIDLTTAGTSTPIFFNYSLPNEDWASSTICLYNVSSTSTTAYCADPLTSSVGFSYIDLPTPGAPITLLAKFQASFPTGPDIYSDSFVINWLYPSSPLSQSCSPPSFDLTNACAGLDVSYNALGFPSLGAIVCGLKTALLTTAQFSLSPSCNSINYFSSNYTSFKGTFPFNTVFQFTDTIDQAIASTTIASSSSFGIPMITQMGAGTTTMYILPVISSSTISNAVGVDNNNLIRNTITWFIWIITCGICFLIIWKV